MLLQQQKSAGIFKHHIQLQSRRLMAKSPSKSRQITIPINGNENNFKKINVFSCFPPKNAVKVFMKKCETNSIIRYILIYTMSIALTVVVYAIHNGYTIIFIVQIKKQN
jgi:hypothetical protein